MDRGNESILCFHRSLRSIDSDTNPGCAFYFRACCHLQHMDRNKGRQASPQETIQHKKSMGSNTTDAIFLDVDIYHSYNRKQTQRPNTIGNRSQMGDIHSMLFLFSQHPKERQTDPSTKQGYRIHVRHSDYRDIRKITGHDRSEVHTKI